MASIVEVNGVPIQQRSWNLSAIWSIPTSHGLVWLKCELSIFVHEDVVIDSIDSPCGPEFLATNRHWILERLLVG